MMDPRTAAAMALFAAVDTDRSGAINAKELQAALSSGGFVFNPRTCKMCIRMFDFDGNGTLSFHEFERLLATLQQWTALFQAADRDRSGKLSGPEVKKLLFDLGFTSLPDSTLEKVWRAYDDDASGVLSYDEVVLLLAQVAAMTSRFQQHDPSRVGAATLSYPQFIDLIFGCL